MINLRRPCINYMVLKKPFKQAYSEWLARRVFSGRQSTKVILNPNKFFDPHIQYTIGNSYSRATRLYLFRVCGKNLRNKGGEKATPHPKGEKG